MVIDRISGSLNSDIRIVRVCNHTADDSTPYFNNQYEVVLGCGSNFFFQPVVIGVSVLNRERLLIGIQVTMPLMLFVLIVYQRSTLEWTVPIRLV